MIRLTTRSTRADTLLPHTTLIRSVVGYRARKNSRLLDLSSRDQDADDFWEKIHPESGERLVLEPEDFYLLISREGVRIPPEYAAEITRSEEHTSELQSLMRTSYAVFFLKIKITEHIARQP